MKKNKQDLVSIVIRTYNRIDTLKKAVESVIAQTYSNIEIIVVNDGNSSIKNVMSYYAKICETSSLKRKIIFVNNKTKQGKIKSANIGLDMASGIYIGFLDDDDYFLSNHVKSHVELMSKQNKKVCFSRTVEEFSDGGLDDFNYYFPGRINRLYLLYFDNYFPINSMIFKKEIMEKIGGFDEKLEVLEDWDFIIRIFLNYEPCFLEKVTAKYSTRLDNSNVRTSIKAKPIWKKNFMYVRDKYETRIKNGEELLIPVSEVNECLSKISRQRYQLTKRLEYYEGSIIYKIYDSFLYKFVKKIYHLTGLQHLLR